MTRKEVIGFFVACIIFAIVFAITSGLKLINPAEAQIIITFVLVLITAVYVKRTSDIAKATKEQADASMKMAEEMREQRYKDSLPLLVPYITRRSNVTQKLEPNEVAYEMLRTGVGSDITWHNQGKGVAINGRYSFWSAALDNPPGKSVYYPPRYLKTLGAGEEEQTSLEQTSFGWDYQLVDQTKPRLEAEYQDIYERDITTVREFRIDEQNRRAFLGELYFTVDGRRLGQEEMKND